MTTLDDITRDIALGRLSDTHLAALAQRIQRLEQVLRDTQPTEHHDLCRVYSTGCDCGIQEKMQMIDDVLSEGLQYSH